MVANWPFSNSAASAASPASSARVLYACPLAWKIWSRSMAPNWLMAPSTGHT